MIKTAKMSLIFLLSLGILQGCLGERLNPMDPKNRHYQSTSNDPVDDDPSKVATPVITPGEDVYYTDIEITIICNTDDADIYYTLDETEPSHENGLLYTDPFLLTEEMTVRARAIKESMDDSDIAEAAYSFQVPDIAFSPAGGTYALQQNVALSTFVSETSIRYTTDGSQPEPTSPLYSSAIPISQNTVIRALAYRDGWFTSNTAQASYYISTTIPVISPSSGVYDHDITISITGEEETVIYFTTDGTTPTSASPIYQNAITLSGNGNLMTVKAMAIKPNCNASSVTSSSFSINTGSDNETIIIDHTCIDISQVPEEWINAAKNTLHIGYGHTSHGSQLITGMANLDAFMGATGLYTFSSTGEGNTLHLYEGDGYGSGDLDHDCGYYPSWVNETHAFLGAPDPTTGRGTLHSEFNVIMWSWCGQVSDRTEETIISNYLEPMTQLENEYPGIIFVYMTGHLDGTGINSNLHLRNDQIREYCLANKKVLYDFEDIESYDPSGVYYGDRYVSDGCNYDANFNNVTDESGDPALPINGDKNWALDWQSTHTVNVDWYDCYSAHSQPINANMKAYAAWWLFARLTGWQN